MSLSRVLQVQHSFHHKNLYSVCSFFKNLGHIAPHALKKQTNLPSHWRGMNWSHLDTAQKTKWPLLIWLVKLTSTDSWEKGNFCNLNWEFKLSHMTRPMTKVNLSLSSHMNWQEVPSKKALSPPVFWEAMQVRQHKAYMPGLHMTMKCTKNS